jgi:hypothetical protein
MAYLDISPMLAAMREQPDTFSLSHGWLKHRPSHHRFKVQADGYVTVDSECGCADLSVRSGQGRELYEALQSWQADYWVPREVNRHFARHFRPAGLWRRWLRKVAALFAKDRRDSAFALYGEAWANSGRPPEPNNDPPPAGSRRPPPMGLSADVRREAEKVIG